MVLFIIPKVETSFINLFKFLLFVANFIIFLSKMNRNAEIGMTEETFFKKEKQQTKQKEEQFNKFHFPKKDWCIPDPNVDFQVMQRDEHERFKNRAIFKYTCEDLQSLAIGTLAPIVSAWYMPCRDVRTLDSAYDWPDVRIWEVIIVEIMARFYLPCRRATHFKDNFGDRFWKDHVDLNKALHAQKGRNHVGFNRWESWHRGVAAQHESTGYVRKLANAFNFANKHLLHPPLRLVVDEIIVHHMPTLVKHFKPNAYGPEFIQACFSIIGFARPICLFIIAQEFGGEPAKVVWLQTIIDLLDQQALPFDERALIVCDGRFPTHDVMELFFKQALHPCLFSVNPNWFKFECAQLKFSYTHNTDTKISSHRLILEGKFDEN